MSLWLSWINSAAGAWTGAMVAATRRNQAAAQTAIFKAMTTSPKPTKRKAPAKRKRS